MLIMVNILMFLFFFQISLKEGVKGKFAYGRNTYDFEEGTMAFLKPNQSIKIRK